MPIEPTRIGIVVLDVWYDPVAGVGQTTLKHPVPTPRKLLRKAAIEAARSELRERLPIEVAEPVVGGRLYRGPRLPDGARHAFVDWSVGHPNTSIRAALEGVVLRAQAWLTRRQSGD